MGAHAERMAAYYGRSYHYRKKLTSLEKAFPLDLIIEGDTGITQRHMREQDKAALQKFNSDIRLWGSTVNASIRGNIFGLMSNKGLHLRNSLKQNYWHYGKKPAKDQEITSIGFSFKESGIFVHLGVGRGYNMENGTVVLTKKDKNSGFTRSPNAWFDPIIEQNIPSLEKILTEYCESLTLNATRIYITK